MEKLVTVLEVLPYVERPYTDKSGNAQVFASKGFVLTDGVDTFYAEMVGDVAKANAESHYNPSILHSVQMQLQIRRWKDAQGAEHCSNEIRIIKMV